MKHLMSIPIIFLVFFAFSCNNVQNEQINAASFDELNPVNKHLYYEVNFKDTIMPEWFSALDSEKMINFYMNAILDGKITAYMPTQGESDFVPISIEDIKNRMAFNDDERDFSEMKRIIFIENWKINKQNSSFKKDVVGMCFVRVYIKDTEEVKNAEFKKKICYVLFDSIPASAKIDK